MSLTSNRWDEEFEKLRRIALGCGLTEVTKWGKPCFTYEGNNVVILQGFKESCSLMFFKGTLLKDTKQLLDTPGENTQAARRFLFRSPDEVKRLAPMVKAYIREAIEVEKAGLKVSMKTTSEYQVPEEFQRRLDDDAALQSAFDELTPGRQRAYLLHFSQAKQSSTRASRVEKCVPRILAGKGLND